MTSIISVPDGVQSQTVDLTNCDREPIHIPGLIQPHGVLLTLQKETFIILQVSLNSESLLGYPPQTLVGQPLSLMVGAEPLEHLREQINSPTTPIFLDLQLTLPEQTRLFNALVHEFDGVLFLELEPLNPNFKMDFSTFYHHFDKAISQFDQATTISALCQTAAELFRAFTGYDRVMVYRFDEDWHGWVVGEAQIEGLSESYLNLHFPASDIPKQARQLFASTLIRHIPHVDYQPFGLTPSNNPLTGAPLDMSFSILRSVSPIHLQYLRNMGQVQSTMTVAIVKDNKMWGLITGHHYAGPLHIPYPLRASTFLIANLMALRLGLAEEDQDKAYQEEAAAIRQKLGQQIEQQHDFVVGLSQGDVTMLDLVEADGAALYVNGEVTLLGQTPPAEAMMPLVEWLHQHSSDNLFQTNRLTAHYQADESMIATASGLLAITLSHELKDYLLWFKPEVIQTVTWAGDPHKPVTQTDQVRLSPRLSFEKWKQELRFTALPWRQDEIAQALALREATLNAIVSQRAKELAELNYELQRSNAELDAFAYISSHDLKEPLRGIHNFSNFLLEDYADRLDEEGLEMLRTLARLAERMEKQISSLLEYSRVGRVDLAIKEVDLNLMMTYLIEDLQIRLTEEHTTVRIPHPLPTIRCDSARIRELFYNLLTNGMKYNRNSERWLEVGYLAQLTDARGQFHQDVFYVKDNGIGIKEKDQETIFKIFRRLHGQDEFGGGTGAGLTIVQKIVERHHGRIWVDSVYGEGTTFHFTLQPL